MNSELKPFEIVEEDRRTILRLHGTASRLARIEAGETQILLTALAEGHDIDLRYTIILGSLDLSLIAEKLDTTEDGRLRVSGNVSIWNSELRGPVSFSGAAFCGNVHFFSSRFICDTSFSGASFRGNTDFRESIFDGYVGFRDVHFYGDVYFWGAAFYGEAQFAGAFAERPASFADVRYRENTVFAGLWNHILHPLLRLPARLISRDLPKRKVTTFFGLNTTIVDGASNPYLKRYIDDEQWIYSWRRRGKVRHSLFFFWELTSHCGRSFGLWVFWVLVSAMAFGAIFADYAAPAWFPEPIVELLVRMDPDLAFSSSSVRVSTQFTPYYFSIVTFTTLGFGDIHPLNLAGEVWLVLEVLLGYIMLGGLIGIFANKFARRS